MEREPAGEGYDAVASEYHERFGGELAHKPLDRALLLALVEQSETGGVIGDLGCGPGHVAAWLAGRGAPAVGIDLSSEMLEVGRQAYPEVEFRLGDLRSLPAGDGEFAAVVCLYSIIHLPPSDLPRAFAEIRRTLKPSGCYLVSFHVGTEVRHLSEWWGHPVDIDFQFFETETVVDLLRSHGLTVEAQLERANYPDEVETRRGYVLGRRQG
jgi:ubiquinone/menaquinone biosynthesis C-methylase UbiE